MIALICPQCGGKIGNVRGGETIVTCSYCEAKIFLQQVEPEPSAKGKRDTLHVPLEDYKPIDEYDPPTHDDGPTLEELLGNTDQTTLKVIAIAAVIGIMVFVFIVVGAIGRNKSKQSVDIQPAPFRFKTTPTPEYVNTTLSNDDAISIPKPILARNVRVKDGFEISVVVSVDEQGFVYDAQSYNGPEILQDAAVAAARKAKFKATGSRSSGVLIYNFGPR